MSKLSFFNNECLDSVEEMLKNPDFYIELFKAIKEERSKTAELERANAIIIDAMNKYSEMELTNELGFSSVIEFNKYLEQMRIQYKQNETWVLYSKYADKGYTDIKQQVLDSGRVVYDRKWTQLGRKFLLELFGV